MFIWYFYLSLHDTIHFFNIFHVPSSIVNYFDVIFLQFFNQSAAFWEVS